MNEEKESDSNLEETIYKQFDYYRHDYGRDELSYQLTLMDGPEQNWYRSDDTITGKWR